LRREKNRLTINQKHLKTERKARGDFGQLFNFFGCRAPDVDLIFHRELSEYARESVISLNVFAFSRYPSLPKEYVQQKLLQNADIVWDLIHNQGAFVYVCGCGSTLGKGIDEALLQIIQSHSSLDASFLDLLREQGRYLLDVWG